MHRGDVRYSSLNYKSMSAGEKEQRTRHGSCTSAGNPAARVFKISKVLEGEQSRTFVSVR
jgi:hypothetical protein